MTATARTVKARRKSSPVDFVWFTRDNHIEVAKWLQGHGVRADVQFHGFGETLSISSMRRDPGKDGEGCWLDSQGNPWSKERFEREFEVVEQP